MGEDETGWTRHGERLVYDNRWVRVALVVDEHQRVLMLWRYRFPVDQWGYELPGGLVDAGETPGAAAARETLEETGWRPTGTLEHLLRFEPLPGQLSAPIDAYLWRRADRLGEPTDPEEAGRVEWVPLHRVPELARRSELLGSGALVPLLFHLIRGDATR